MKVTILGAGTCTSQIPGVENQYPPAFLVEWGQEKMVFDCSEGLRFRLEKAGFDYSDVHHLAISHPHPDHCALVHYIQSVYVKGLRDREQFLNPQLHVYCPDFIKDHFPELWNFHLPELQNQRYPWPELIWHGLSGSGGVVQSIGQATLTAFPVYHGFGKVDALSYRLETPEGVFAYSGDTGICDGLRACAQDADIFVCEASARIGDQDTATGYGHLNPEQAGQIAAEAGVKKLILFHYSGLDSDQAMIESVRRSGFVGDIVIGKDFTNFVVE